MKLRLSPAKKTILYSAVFTALLSVGCSIHSVYTAPTVTAAAIPEQTQPNPSYYATLVGNHVVIYQDGGTEPFLTTDIDVRTLPDTDQKLLNQGIVLSDKTAIEQFLQDYDS